MEDERKRILRMLENGLIKADEAEKLLETIEEEDKKASTEEKKGLSLKIEVEEAGEEKVNISIPLDLARSFIDVVPPHARQKIEKKGFDLDELLEKAGQTRGNIVDVEDGNDRVKISIE